MGIFGGGGKPKPVKSARMPDPEDKNSEEARRRMMRQYSSNKSGRASTVLSGDSYSGSKLGSGG